jgi:hypothetical protein
MYEPGDGTPTPVPYGGLTEVQILCTSSTNEVYYKTFETQTGALKFWKPSARLEELETMGIFVPDAHLMVPSLQERVKEMGPFTRLVFSTNNEWKGRMKTRSDRIDKLSLMDMLKIVNVEEEKEFVKTTSLSHYFIRLEVVRTGPEAYEDKTTTPACQGILNLVQQQLDKTEF